MGTSSSERAQEPFEALYEKYRQQVFAYCTRRVGSSEAADACAETFLVAWRRLEEVPEPPDTLPYLYGIAANVISNQRRALRRRTRLNSKLRNLGVAPSVNPSTIVVRDDQAREVEDAVRRLKPKDREIVMLYAWEDLSRETIADMLGMTKVAVDQRIHRSYKRLARILKPKINPVPSPPIIEKGGSS
ncbi:MAG: RNA polymerase sigma factor [Actinomycetota bacterium]